jgi:hypothetical protein
MSYFPAVFSKVWPRFGVALLPGHFRLGLWVNGLLIF